MLTWKIFKAFHLQCLWNFSHLPKPMRGRDLRCDRNRLNFLICFSQLRKETMRGIGNSLFILSPLVSNWSHCQPNKIVWQYYQQTGLILNEVIFLQRWGKKTYLNYKLNFSSWNLCQWWGTRPFCLKVIKWKFRSVSTYYFIKCPLPSFLSCLVIFYIMKVMWEPL